MQVKVVIETLLPSVLNIKQAKQVLVRQRTWWICGSGCGGGGRADESRVPGQLAQYPCHVSGYVALKRTEL